MLKHVIVITYFTVWVHMTCYVVFMYTIGSQNGFTWKDSYVIAKILILIELWFRIYLPIRYHWDSISPRIKSKYIKTILDRTYSDKERTVKREFRMREAFSCFPFEQK